VLGHHHKDEAFLSAHAEVEALYQRLGHDIETLDDRGDPASRQALTDAGERYNTAGAQFGHATTTGELAVVRSIIVDGLQATRVIRNKQGLDPGPDPALAAPLAPVGGQAPEHGGVGGFLHSHGGLGAALGAGAAGGVLGMLGGAALGEMLGGGDEDREGWGDRDGGDWGGDGGGGGDWGGDDE
jgi:hypothetical protein